MGVCASLGGGQSQTPEPKMSSLQISYPTPNTVNMNGNMFGNGNVNGNGYGNQSNFTTMTQTQPSVLASKTASASAYGTAIGMAALLPPYPSTNSHASNIYHPRNHSDDELKQDESSMRRRSIRSPTKPITVVRKYGTAAAAFNFNVNTNANGNGNGNGNGMTGYQQAPGTPSSARAAGPNGHRLSKSPPPLPSPALLALSTQAAANGAANGARGSGTLPPAKGPNSYNRGSFNLSPPNSGVPGNGNVNGVNGIANGSGANGVNSSPRLPLATLSTNTPKSIEMGMAVPPSPKGKPSMFNIATLNQPNNNAAAVAATSRPSNALPPPRPPPYLPNQLQNNTMNSNNSNANGNANANANSGANTGGAANSGTSTFLSPRAAAAARFASGANGMLPGLSTPALPPIAKRPTPPPLRPNANGNGNALAIQQQQSQSQSQSQPVSSGSISYFSDLERNKKSSTRVNRRIEDQLSAQYKSESSVLKLLLLGPGESGKSTLFKQCVTLYGRGFSERERSDYTPIVHSNVVESMKTLIRASRRLASEYNLHFQQSHAMDEATAYVMALKDDMALNRTVAGYMKAVWSDKGMKELFSLRSKFQISDECAFFFDALDRLADDQYIPSYDDILRCRARTTGINETEFKVGNNAFHLIDVGGQRSERRKWLHCFSGVTAILFVAAINEYDQTLMEDNETNRLHESINLFGQICNSPHLERTAIILFLNKTDIFRSKFDAGANALISPSLNASSALYTKAVPLNVCFPDYVYGTNFEQALRFIRDKFLERNEVLNKEIFVHYTCATDTNNIKFTLDAVTLILRERSLRSIGLI